MELTISFMMAPPSKQTIGSTPPLSSRERLSDALYVRMTQRERELLNREARKRGVTASELVRAADYGRAGRDAKKSKPDPN